MDEIRCSRCGAIELQTGFLSDTGQGALGAARWVAGQLDIGFFGARTRGRTKLAVLAFRCPECAHLELFTAPA
jgi:hypothetical protein